jgi:hypothetical protein
VTALANVPPTTPNPFLVQPPPPQTADEVVRAAARSVAPISLGELTALAELQTRIDRKYFVPATAFQALTHELDATFRVLDIEGTRTFGYESVYFDDPGLATYRAHLQRRRLRFKVRTRTYVDSGLCMFEVKLAGARGQTVKLRIPHPVEHRHVLTEQAHAHLATALGEAFGRPPPAVMQPVLSTTYRRTTFVSGSGEMRLTCDVGLVCRGGGGALRAGDAHVLVESKSMSPGGSAVDRLLRRLGVRETRVSKYAVGVGALHRGLPANPWHRTLRRYFELAG